MSNPQNFPQHWILIRGLTRSHIHWFDFKEIFKKEFQLQAVFTPELPGNGELSQLQTPRDISTCIESLKKQLPPLNQSVGIVGISLGGMIAAEWAVRYPNEVSHLVLINTSSTHSSFYQRFKPNLYLQVLKTILFSTPARIENFILRATSNTNKWKNVLAECIQLQHKHPIQISNFIQQLRLARSSAFNNKPHCKILILTSEKDRLVSHKCSVEIARNWNLQPRIHPTAGHDLPLDDADWIVDQVRSEFKP